MKKLTSVQLTQKLVQIKSVSPDAEKCLDLIEDVLKNENCKMERLKFSGDNSYDVDNLYVKFGNGSPHIMLCGHVDVVPIGNLKDWTKNPWGGDIENGLLYGRGSADMKSGVASGLISAINVARKENFKGSISLLITCDEEALSINGIKKAVEHLDKKGEKWDKCITLEPTNLGNMNDQIKVGRRGVLTAKLKSYGIQGHAAYPKNTLNAIHEMNKLISSLVNEPLDKGNKYFDPSSLQIVDIKGGAGATNVVPGVAEAVFNIRFCSEYNTKTLEETLRKRLDKTKVQYKLEVIQTGDCFFTDPNENPLADELSNSIIEVLKTEGLDYTKPKYVTNGGSSDSRFVKNYCPVVDYGVDGRTIHKVDENVPVQDIELLTKIMENFLEKSCC